MLGAQDRDPHGVSARDGGLRRISRLTGWIVAGSVVMTGGLAKLAADAFGGRSGNARAAKTAPRAAQAQQTDSSQAPSDQGLQAPAQPPSDAGAGSGTGADGSGASSDPGVGSDPGAGSDQGGSADPGASAGSGAGSSGSATPDSGGGGAVSGGS